VLYYDRRKSVYVILVPLNRYNVNDGKRIARSWPCADRQADAEQRH
jgi:hypothetical protein